MIRTFSDLEVYKLSYPLAMEVFRLAKNFPAEEKYSLTSQIIRSTRSISANIAEGFGKRVYQSEFKKHLVYSIGSLEESKVWLSFAKDCDYTWPAQQEPIVLLTDELGAKFNKLYINWK